MHDDFDVFVTTTAVTKTPVTRQLLRVGAVVALASGLIAPSAASALPTIKITKATFAREVTKDFKTNGETTVFDGKQTVNLLLRIKGRPKSGTVEGQWTFRGKEIDSASIDLASINKGVVFSFGQDTFVNLNFTPGPTGLPIGQSYFVNVKVNAAAAGSYQFSIAPPTGALASVVSKTRLSNADGGPAKTTFAPTDTVYLLFTGDFGIRTWVESNWTVNGKADSAGTRSLELTENKKAVDGNFLYLPKGGWPTGKHSVSLIMNDKSVGTYQFNVA